MKNKLLILVILSLFVGPAFGANNMLKKAMKAYESRDYLTASSMLLDNMNTFTGKNKEVAQLYLGIINTKNAEFHKSLHTTSLESSKSYLDSLAKVKGKKRSKVVSLFLGEVYLNKGEYKNALKYLKKFKKTKGISKELDAIASTLIGQAYYLSGSKKGARSYWSKIKKPKTSVELALIAAKERSGEKVKYDINKLLSSYKKMAKGKNGITGRDISNIVYLLGHKQKYEDGITILTSQQVDTPSYVEKFSDEKQIAFYDVTLLESSSQLFLGLGNKYLTQASSSSKFAPTAALYQIDSGIIFDDSKQIQHASKSLVAGSKLPRALSKLRPVKLNAGEYLSGKKKAADSAREDIIKKNGADPSVIGEVLVMCAYTKADCTSILTHAKQVSAKTQGRRYVPLNKGIGRYLLSLNKPTEALTYLELARDKSNKNKLSANDPILLVDLASAYRKDSVYLETLEILFEMNRFYPAVRQIQEAIQGTYAMHQKSAGDVKIF